jgi:hypothetical protein
MHINLTEAEKAELGINENNEVFIIKADSSDFCGIWECFAVQAKDEESALELIELEYDGMVYDSLQDYYNLEDIEELGDISYNLTVEDASEWESRWLSTSAAKVNF